MYSSNNKHTLISAGPVQVKNLNLRIKCLKCKTISKETIIVCMYLKSGSPPCGYTECNSMPVGLFPSALTMLKKQYLHLHNSDQTVCSTFVVITNNESDCGYFESSSVI